MSTAAAPFSVSIPPLTTRARTVVRSLASLARDPGRLDEVLSLLQAMNLGAVARAGKRLAGSVEGQALLTEQPRIDRASVDWDALERLPDGTLGREYLRFLRSNDITPEAFEKLPDVGDPRAAYVMLRMRQTHDLWHVLTGYAPDVRGEILLQAFTYAQTGAPGSAMIALFGSLRWALRYPGQISALREAYRRGKATAFLPTFRWEAHWATPVRELRATLTCPPMA